MSKKQYYVIIGKTSEGKYKLTNRTDLSVTFFDLDELILFGKDKFNDVKLDEYMINIYAQDEVYTFFNK